VVKKCSINNESFSIYPEPSFNQDYHRQLKIDNRQLRINTRMQDPSEILPVLRWILAGHFFEQPVEMRKIIESTFETNVRNAHRHF
jgi:hypothetical protein